MKRLSIAIFIIIISFIASSAQTASPTPPQEPIESDELIVKISTTLIQVDVTVTDKNGKIVKDLKPTDFEIYEDGQKQKITNFSFISAESKTKPIANPTINKYEVNTPLPSSQLRPERVNHTIALVIDDLGVSFENMIFVKRALRKFVDEQMQPNDLVAIMGSGGGSGILQQFTNDKTVLHAAIQKINWNPSGNAGISSFIPFKRKVLNEDDLNYAYFSGNAEDRRRNFDKIKEKIDAENEFEKKSNEFRTNYFVIGTLGTLNSVITWMSRMPSRKSIMFFSDGFQICPTNNGSNNTKLSSCTQMTETLKQLTEAANRASITIYTQDSHGLAATNLTAEDSFNINPGFQEQLASSALLKDADVREKQDGLAYLADETGGKVFINNNDFNQSFTQVLEDQKGFYLLGYQPESDFFSKKEVKFNKLIVKISRPDLKVRYRSGFFGISEPDKNKQKAIQNVRETSAQKLMTAITSPFTANELDIKLNSLFGYNDKAGLFLNNLVFIDPKNLTFSEELNGDKKTNFDILALLINEDQQIISSISKHHNLTVKKENYQKLLNEGFVYTFVTPLKEAKFYQMRLAVQDTVSSKLGSANQFLEIPDIKNKKLALSSLNLESYTTKEWNNLSNSVKAEKQTDPLADTASRIFKKGTVLSYGLEIYNAKLQQNTVQLKTKIRLFKDGKLFLENEFSPLTEQPNKGVLTYKGAFSLGENFSIGEYVLQVIIQDSLAKEKEQIKTQWTQFEVID